MKNRSRIALLMIAVFLFGTVSITAYQSTSNVIALVDDGEETHYETEAQDVQELLNQLELELAERDTVEPALETEIMDNMTITIERWKPTINYSVDGVKQSKITEEKTVGDFITSLGITLDDDDIVEPALETEINEDMNVVIKTKEVKTETEIRPMSFNTKIVETDDLAFGTTKVKQEGKNGEKTVVLERTYLGGKLVDEQVKKVTVNTKPVDKIVLKGTLNSVKDSYSGEQYSYTKVFNMETTAYTSTDSGCSNITASGMNTFVGMVAVDPKVIPLGTKLYIEGYGVAIAGDTGGAIKGNIVDLYFNTKKQCYNYGRQHGVKVYVLKDQSINVKAERQDY